MWLEPDDLAVVRRMRAAHARACTALHIDPALDRDEVWGWQGRTLSKFVVTSDGPGWLRLASARADRVINIFWNGAVAAQRILPPAIPRPQLRRWYDWLDGDWTYRGELYEYVATDTIAAHAVIVAIPSLPSAWWAAVRTTLEKIAVVDTTRVAVEPGFLAWAMPRYLGISASDYAGLPWTTAHGDFHFANLCAPQLCILDWEGLGRAPAGYDAAMLHSYSLLAPDTAAEVNRMLAPWLQTASGRYAELVVITELLHAATQGINQVLAEPLRHRAMSILIRSARLAQRRDRSRPRRAAPRRPAV